MRRYLAVKAWFVLALMSEPLIVTLPLVLLLLDFWPLLRPPRLAMLREKILRFALPALAPVVIFRAHRQSGQFERLRPLDDAAGTRCTRVRSSGVISVPCQDPFYKPALLREPALRGGC